MVETGTAKRVLYPLPRPLPFVRVSHGGDRNCHTRSLPTATTTAIATAIRVLHGTATTADRAEGAVSSGRIVEKPIRVVANTLPLPVA